jgi:CRISPR system Cascade subunit CasE
LIVLTESKPSWAHVIESAGWEDADGAEARIASLEPLLALVVLGRQFSFKVCVNPVSATQKPEGAALASRIERARAESGGRVRGARVAQRTAAQQTNWFLARVAGWGFKIPPVEGPLVESGAPDLILGARRTMTFWKGGSAPVPVTLSTATFTGRLEIIDPVLFRTSLLEGIGRARAYGCGLITLGPPNEPSSLDG